MRFIKFNYANGDTTTILYEKISRIESVRDGEIMVYQDGFDPFTFPVDENYFYSEVFSDVDDKEYALVEITEGDDDDEEDGDEKEPPKRPDTQPPVEVIRVEGPFYGGGRKEKLSD